MSIREKWLKALRSGDYEQTTAVLRDAHGYCCLGVACEVLGYERRGSNHYATPEGLSFACLLGDAQLKLLFPELSEKRRSDLQNELSIRNDCTIASFEEIADFVEWVFNHEDPSGALARGRGEVE